MIMEASASSSRFTTVSSVAIAALLLAMAVLHGGAPGVSAERGVDSDGILVNVTIVNQLRLRLNATIPATDPLGEAKPKSIFIAPGGTGVLLQNPLPPLVTPRGMIFRVDNVEYAAPGSGLITRVAGITGSVSIIVSAPCGNGLLGLEISGVGWNLDTYTSCCALPVAVINY